MVRADDDFHDFVVGFAGPLTSLAYLLIVRPDQDVTSEAQQRCVAALVHTRRRWRDVQLTGAPEPIAIEALLGRLPRRRLGQTRSKDAPARVAERPAVTGLPLEPIEPDIAAVRKALWDAWRTLDPRYRVPLVFADPSVASRRLAAFDVPEDFASSRRLNVLERQAIVQLHDELAGNPVLPRQFVSDAGELRELLAAALTEHAQDVTGPGDAFVEVNTEAAHTRRRAGLVVAGVVVVLVAAITAMVGISTSRDRATTQAAAASASLASAQARAQVTAAPARVGDLVVGWPTRGDLRNDTALSVSLRTAFVAAHPDATGQVQVLLVTDTPWFRVAYLTAHSRAGVLQSWFYGPIGSNTLTEGAFSYGSVIADGGVIAEVLADTTGHAVLVVIAPPDVADVRLVDSELEEVTPGQHFSEVSHSDGIAIRDESGVYVPSLLLQVVEGPSLAWNGSVGTIQLAGSASFATGSALPRTPPAGPAPSTAPDSIPVQRGTADPGLLAAARFVMQQWQHTGELGSGGVPTVLWGGNDTVGTKIVVMRVRTLHLADLVVIAWTDRPVADGEYLLAPGAADYPLGFAYSGLDGPRIGIVVPNGVMSVALVVDGVAQGKQPVSATGFASLPVSGQYGTLADQTFVVEMFDAAGHRVGTTPVPPTV